MSLFRTVKRIEEYIAPVKKKHQPRVIIMQQMVKSASWMENLHLLCHNDAAHPLPVKMVHIGTIADPAATGGFRYIYACPYGRHSGNACEFREYWVIGPKGQPRRIWRGKYNGS